MAENYNLNSGFGFNISAKNSSKAPTEKRKIVNQNELNEAVGGLFDSMTNYVREYENVFNGDVSKEINMYTRQSMIVGMNLKAADNNIRKFDINI